MQTQGKEYVSSFFNLGTANLIALAKYVIPWGSWNPAYMGTVGPGGKPAQDPTEVPML